MRAQPHHPLAAVLWGGRSIETPVQSISSSDLANVRMQVSMSAKVCISRIDFAKWALGNLRRLAKNGTGGHPEFYDGRQKTIHNRPLQKL